MKLIKWERIRLNITPPKKTQFSCTFNEYEIDHFG